MLTLDSSAGQICLFEGLYQDEILVPFPKALIKDENEKKAVLTYLACGDAYAYLDVLLKTMLAGKLPWSRNHSNYKIERKLTICRDCDQSLRD